MSALTRIEARELIRRDILKKLTSVGEWARLQTGTNTLGDPASTHPSPTNEEMNSQLNRAVQYVNRECQLGHIEDVEVSVSAQTSDGPLGISLRTLSTTNTTLTPGDINLVKRVYWDDGTTTRRIPPRSRELLDRDAFRDWQQDPASVAYNFWIEGYNLYLLPAPATAGTLHLMLGTGILTFRSDADSLDPLPTDYHDVVWSTAAWLIAQNLSDDSEMLKVALMQEKLSAKGIAQILAWKRDVNAQEEDRMVAATDRVATRRMGNRFNTNDYRPMDCW